MDYARATLALIVGCGAAALTTLDRGMLRARSAANPLERRWANIGRPHADIAWLFRSTRQGYPTVDVGC